MANIKISDMASSGDVQNADIFPLVRSGNNYQNRRDQIFVAGAGELLTLVGGSEGFFVSQVGKFGMFQKSPNDYRWTHGTSTIFYVTGGGTILIESVPGEKVAIAANAGVLQIDGSGNIDITPSPGGNVNYYYSPLNPGDWSGSPTNLRDAVDRIASRLVAIGGGPIP